MIPVSGPDRSTVSGRSDITDSLVSRSQIWNRSGRGGGRKNGCGGRGHGRGRRICLHKIKE